MIGAIEIVVAGMWGLLALYGLFALAIGLLKISASLAPNIDTTEGKIGIALSILAFTACAVLMFRGASVSGISIISRGGDDSEFADLPAHPSR